MSDLSAYFLPDGDAFVPTELTRGPWSRQHQHGGPPAALLARAIEMRSPEFQLVRMTVEFLRPIPIAPLVVKVEPLRAGRKVERVTATLLNAGDPVAQAAALLVRPAAVDVPVRVPEPAPASPEASAPFSFPFFSDPISYDLSVEVRIARGVFGSGAVFAWMRLRVPLIPGEAPSAMQRVLVVADSGSGVSVMRDPARLRFINPDLTVYLYRPPESDWVGLDSVTIPQPIGVGLADTGLHDTRGAIGRALQSLMIEGLAPLMTPRLSSSP